MIRKNVFSKLYHCLLVAAVAFAGITPVADAQSSQELRTWGLESLQQIQTDFSLKQPGLYADEWKAGSTIDRAPAFMWGCGVLLPALVAAAKCDRVEFEPLLKTNITAIDTYWNTGGSGAPAYDVLPGPKTPDRYYDDNEWVALALVDAYELTRDKLLLHRAVDVYNFLVTGEDEKLGGGIYWRENEKTSKNACSNAPAIALAARLFQVTHDRKYSTSALRWYKWTNAHLQDSDGLYWDNIRLDGSVEKTKWTYNTALMLRSNCLLYSISHEKRFLEEARRIAEAARKRWIYSETGAIADGGQFAHLLCEAYLALDAIDKDGSWRTVALHALDFVRHKLRDTNGRYGDRWDKSIDSPLARVSLLSQASVARAFLIASVYTKH